jgi:signal transduction histidine kinase
MWRGVNAPEPGRFTDSRRDGLDRGRYCADADSGVRIRRENQPTVEECTRKSGTSCLTLRSAPLRLERATQEGRAALNSLRAATAQTNDLAETLRRVTKDDLIPSSMAVTFSVVGDAREMHPIVRDEIYRIAYEGIRNACTHSGATRLEVELRYAHDLALRVSDNGTGIDPAIADGGKDGHFGLQGMRERAARIGGNLTLGSSSNSGTEIKLVVPGDIVFRQATAVHRTLLTKIKVPLRGRAACPMWTDSVHGIFRAARSVAKSTVRHCSGR